MIECWWVEPFIAKIQRNFWELFFFNWTPIQILYKRNWAFLYLQLVLNSNNLSSLIHQITFQDLFLYFHCNYRIRNYENVVLAVGASNEILSFIIRNVEQIEFERFSGLEIVFSCVKSLKSRMNAMWYTKRWVMSDEIH